MNNVKLSNATTVDELLSQAKNLPTSSGCYLMKNRFEEVIYVGKAKNLKSRVSSYFQKSAKTPKTEILVKHIKDFEFILTETETEAFVLENNLIKKYAPKYNIQLRDDKTYPYVLVDYSEPYPRLTYVRRFKKKKNQKVFGPFVWGSNISEILEILTKSFQLRDCTLREFKSRTEPCLLYQMKQCSAPCVSKISDENYDQDLKMALSFFGDKSEKALQHLEKQMQVHSDREEFERAAMLRDSIEKLIDFQELSLQRNIELVNEEKNIDVINIYKGSIDIDISIYMVRNGLLLGHKNFHFPVLDLVNEVNEEVINYIGQYYDQTVELLPDKIVTPFSKSECKFLEEIILDSKILSNSKKYQNILDLTYHHAKESQKYRHLNKLNPIHALEDLKSLLNLSELPRHIECFDIAIWQGKSPTASQVVFTDGVSNKKLYRHYHIEERAEGNNDFAMMEELLGRRLKKGKFPDLLVVDGGKGQVSSFQKILEENDLNIPLVGIAKAKTKENEKTEERLIIPGRSNPYILKKNKKLLKLFVDMRDEAHRFSRVLHHKTEKRRIFSSELDNIPGIGEKAKQRILRKWKRPLKELNRMSERELMINFRLTKLQAQKLKNYFED